MVCCKIFVGALIGIVLQWFSGFPKGSITSFQEFSSMFKEKKFINKIEPPRLANLFDVRQREGESCKDYLNRFCVVSVCLRNSNEELVVDAFVKGRRASWFSDSLIWNRVESLTEIRERAAVHIEMEEAIKRKRVNELQR